jgi:hypothetical protein
MRITRDQEYYNAGGTIDRKGMAIIVFNKLMWILISMGGLLNLAFYANAIPFPLTMSRGHMRYSNTTSYKPERRARVEPSFLRKKVRTVLQPSNIKGSLDISTARTQGAKRDTFFGIGGKVKGTHFTAFPFSSTSIS